jgi:hypothetical protein
MGAELQARHIRGIRVTTDALAGSIVALPITPERARSYRLLMIEGRGAVADPVVYERDLEVLVHPEDWRDFLKNLPNSVTFNESGAVGSVREVMGIPVIHQ